MKKMNARMKDIDIKYHFSREPQNQGKVEFKYGPTEDMVVDILSKPLASIKTST